MGRTGIPELLVIAVIVVAVWLVFRPRQAKSKKSIAAPTPPPVVRAAQKEVRRPSPPAVAVSTPPRLPPADGQRGIRSAPSKAFARELRGLVTDGWGGGIARQ